MTDDNIKWIGELNMQWKNVSAALEELKIEWHHNNSNLKPHEIYNEAIKDVKKALARLVQSQALTQTGYQWQDISTAPKKGRYLGIIEMKTGGFGEPFVCEWDEDDGHICQFQTDHFPHKPTHWMPLPTAPISVKEQK
jgi:hypothetical protein